MFFAGKAKPVNNLPGFVFRLLNPLADFHLLLPGQQRHLAHLPQIHPHGVIQNIEPARLIVFAQVRRSAPVHLRRINNVNLEVAEFGQHLIQVFGGHDVVGQGIVDVVVGQVALFLGLAQQVFDFLG